MQYLFFKRDKDNPQKLQYLTSDGGNEYSPDIDKAMQFSEFDWLFWGKHVDGLEMGAVGDDIKMRLADAPRLPGLEE